MTVQVFNCPKCGAPVEFTPDDSASMRCPYCKSTIMIPEELLSAKPASVDFSSLLGQESQIINESQKNLKKRNTIILIAVILWVLAFTFIPLAIINHNKTAQSVDLPTETIVQPTSTPAITATPGFAYTVNSFGKGGIGPGLLNNESYIGVDGGGNLYLAGYDDGRIQRFASAGKYQSLWKIGADSETFIYGMAVSYDSKVFISDGPEILMFNGLTGELLNTFTSPNGGEFGDLCTTADGHLAAVWYEGRWGMITSLEGHREDLVIFDADGNITQTVPSFISNHTDDPALDVTLAVDGSGVIYALSDSYVYVFSATGEFINRFGSEGDLPGQFDSPNGIAVDGLGRVYVLDRYTIHVFSKGNIFIDDIPINDYLGMLTIDTQNRLWGVADEKVIEYELRGGESN